MKGKMLNALDCLDIYWDGRHYDLTNADFTEDIPFYKRLVAKYGGPVLELACGTGRVTIPIAEMGYDVVGLDISEPMLAHARKKSKRLNITWVKGDCRDFDLGRKFKTIIFPFNALAHLHDRESIEACFSCVRRHMLDDGVFVLDIFNPSLKVLTREPEKRFTVCEYDDPDGLGKLVLTENNSYDDAKQLNHIKWHFAVGGKETTRELDMRMFFPMELDALLHYNGLEIVEKFGNYDGEPFGPGSKEQIPICILKKAVCSRKYAKRAEKVAFLA